jgi:hypothetical protein
MRGFRRPQIAALAPEQHTPHALFERMQRPMHANRTHIESLCRLGQVFGLHVREQDFQLAKGDFFVDSVRHLGLENGHI